MTADTPREPVTEAGRRWVRGWHTHEPNPINDLVVAELTRAILAIEAEARAAGLREAPLDVERLSWALIGTDARYPDGSGDGPGLDGATFTATKAPIWAAGIAAEYDRLAEPGDER